MATNKSTVSSHISKHNEDCSKGSMFLLDEGSCIKTGSQNCELAKGFAFESFQPLQKHVQDKKVFIYCRAWGQTNINQSNIQQ